LLRDLPPRARWYTLFIIALGAVVFAWGLPLANLQPLTPLLLLIALSALTSAFKVQFPIASGSNMSVSYVVDIAALILRGPHAAMVVGAASGLTQSTVNSRSGNPLYRTLFNMACVVITVQAAGQVYTRLGGTSEVGTATAVPLVAMAVTYYLVNTLQIAVAIALATGQGAWRVWRSDFASSGTSYVVGAATAAVVIAVTERSGYWLMLLMAAPPLYLTYRLYQAGRKTEARQGAILEAAQDAIVTVDHSLNIREFNPAAERMFGRSRMTILGKNVELLLPVAGRTAQLAVLTGLLRTGAAPDATAQQELTAVRADGVEFPVELTVARLTGDSGAAVTVFLRDVTERRALEEQLRQSQKLEAIGRLAGGVAHDFNNILMSIMGSADLLLMEMRRDDPARGEANEIKLSVQRGAALTRQLLAFSKRQATSPRLFAVTDVLSGMDTMLRRLMGPEIELGIVHDGSPAKVVADPAQIEQVVLNLVVNARDAMPDGGRLTVSVDEVDLDEAVAAAEAEGKPGRYVRLSVSDTGTGIDERTRARLFEPFFTTKEEGKGSGLGLSIVYGIVKQSGGYIHVVSEPGSGATFRILLPVASVTAPRAALV
jgi:PAS domain S-box-containing protein